jgi:Glycosyl transferases group 1
MTKASRLKTSRRRTADIRMPVTSLRYVTLIFMIAYLSFRHLQSEKLFHNIYQNEMDIDDGTQENDSIEEEQVRNAKVEGNSNDITTDPKYRWASEEKRSEKKRVEVSKDIITTQTQIATQNDNEVALRNYHPSTDPVLDAKNKPSNRHPVQVYFWTGPSNKNSATTKFLLEGIERSQYLKLIHISFRESNGTISSLAVHNDQDRRAPLLWVADILALEHDCHALEALLDHAMVVDSKGKRSTRVVWFDYSSSSETLICPNFRNQLQQSRTSIPLRIAKRNIVYDRVWDAEQSWVRKGHINQNPGLQFSSGPILYISYPVRESIVTEVAKYIDHQRIQRDLKKLRPVDSKRILCDVAFFVQEGDAAHYSQLRRSVANTVASLDGMKIGENRTFTTVVKYSGDTDQVAQDGSLVFSKYIEKMIGTKIIVVAQRDEWEGHFRLMESLASGALVFSDEMIVVPDGLIHGKNIIFYNNQESLKSLLLHYLHPDNDKERLSIAKKGWELVLGHHRCWHGVEQIIFGNAMTAVDASYQSPPPRRARDKPKVKGGKKASFLSVPEEEIPSLSIANDSK